MRRKIPRSASLQVIPIMIVAPARYSYHARRAVGLENYCRDSQRFPRALYFAGNFVGRSDSRNLTRTIEIAAARSDPAGQRFPRFPNDFTGRRAYEKYAGDNRIAGCMMDAGTRGEHEWIKKQP